MKKAISRSLLALLCLLAFALPAQAADDALPPEILSIFEGEAWAGYTIPANYYRDEHGYADALAVLKKGDENILCLLEKPNGTDWQVVAQCPGILLPGDRIPVIQGEEYYKFSLFYTHKPGDSFLDIRIERLAGQWQVTCVSVNPYTPDDVRLPIRMPDRVDQLVFYPHASGLFYTNPALDYRNMRIDDAYPRGVETFDTAAFLAHAHGLLNPNIPTPSLVFPAAP
ncbi:MAG: hypothetical protein LBN04_03480 [Oscillospiraceae bacterium]|nr:hypothetical protein [Oscillospiraceae bacterium]